MFSVFVKLCYASCFYKCQNLSKNIQFICLIISCYYAKVRSRNLVALKIINRSDPVECTCVGFFWLWLWESFILYSMLFQVRRKSDMWQDKYTMLQATICSWIYTFCKTCNTWFPIFPFHHCGLYCFVLFLLKLMSLVSDSNKMHANSEFVFFILWGIWGVGCSMTATVFSMLYIYPLFSQWSIFCDHCNIVKKINT